MLDLEIVDTDGYVYHLMEEKGKIYEFNLEFWDINEMPKVRRSYIDKYKIVESNI